MRSNLHTLARSSDRPLRRQGFAFQRTWLSRMYGIRADRVVHTAFRRADDPGLVLDVSRSVGRFWPVIMEKPNRRLIAVGADMDTLLRARDAQPPTMAEHIYPFRTGFSRIDLPEEGVDCVSCIGLWETGLDATQRSALLEEFHRLTREAVIVSVCVDGNIGSWNQAGRARRGQPLADPWRLGVILHKEVIEQEFTSANFKILDVLELFPMVSPWRVYVLRKIA